MRLQFLEALRALKRAQRSACKAVRLAVSGAPLAAALLLGASPAKAGTSASLNIDVNFQGIANITTLYASTGSLPGTINLTWTEPVRDAGVAPFLYEVRVSTVGQIPNDLVYSTSPLLSTFSPSTPPAPGPGGGNTGFVVTGLTPYVTYYFAIEEHDSGALTGHWIQSAALSLNTTNFAYPTGAPPPPASGAILAASTATVTADWTLSAGATDYILAASLNPSGTPIAASSTTVLTTATVSGLAPNTTYYMSVSGCDIGCSVFTPIGSTITLANSAIALSSTAASSNSFSVAFSTNGNPPGTLYRVEFSTDGVDYTVGVTTGATAGAGAATVGSLSGGTTYFVEVVAINSGGSPSAPSNVVQVLTNPGPPAVPVGAPLLVYSSSVTVQWSLSPGATDYVLEASTSPTRFPIAASTTTLTSTGTVTGLSVDTTYYFFVSACGNGCSAFGADGSTVTLANPAIALSTTAVSSTTVSLAWNQNGNPPGVQYRVEISTDGVDYTIALTTTGAAATPTGLTPGTTYSFEIVSVNSAGNPSGPSNVVNVLTTPKADSGGSPIAVFSSSVTVSWPLDMGATDYVLVASPNPTGAPVVASSTTVNSTGTVSGLNPNATYYFFLQSCGDGCSAFAAAGSTVTLANSAIALSTTAVSSTTVSLAWNQNGNPAGTRYRVEISTDGVDYTIALTTTGAAGIATGLTPGTTYSFEIVSVNSAGNPNGPSNVVNVLTTPGADSGGSPIAVFQSSVTVSWPLDMGATDYVLVASTSPTRFPIAASTTTVNSTGTVTGLGPNATYYFFLQSCGDGCSAFGTAGSTVTLANPAVALSTTAVSSTTVSLAWNQNGNPPGTRYRVEISTDGVDYSIVLTTTAAAGVSTGLTPGTTYSFEIVAVNFAGNPSGPSNVVNVLTAPPAPTGGAPIAVFQSSATVTWGLSMGATDYILVASTSPTDATVAATTTTVNSTGTVTGLGPNATYYFFVEGCGDGCSGFAAAGSSVTLAAPALALSTTSLTYDSVGLAWTAGGNPAGTLFQLMISTDGVDFSTQTAPSVALSTTVASLMPSTTYFFEVRSINWSGTPTLSSILKVVILPLPILPEVPMEPIGVTITASSTTATLAWSPVGRYTDGTLFTTTGTPVAAELEGYQIYRSTQICSSFVQISTLTISSTSLVDATGGLNYFYRIFSYNTIGQSTGPITISTLGERYYFVDDCVTNLAVDPNVATAVNGLVGATNGLGGDIRIVRTRRPMDVGNGVFQSAQWLAYLNGATWLPNYSLPQAGHYTIHVTTAGANAIPDNIAISSASPFDQSLVPLSPDTLAAGLNVVSVQDLGAWWFNNQNWAAMYGKIDAIDANVDFDTTNLGVYQIRAQSRTNGSPVFDISNISSRVITPDAPGHNSVLIFTYDPGPNNVQPTGRIYTLHGEHVGDMAAGIVPNTLTWDGRMNGRTVTSGVYIYHISGGGKTFTGTVVVAK
jgi:hypothetical protein